MVLFFPFQHSLAVPGLRAAGSSAFPGFYGVPEVHSAATAATPDGVQLVWGGACCQQMGTIYNLDVASNSNLGCFLNIPIVPHKAVAENSKIGNL